MKVKFIIANKYEELERKINEFTKDKKVVDIKPVCCNGKCPPMVMMVVYGGGFLKYADNGHQS